MVRFALDVCMVVTGVLIIVFWGGKNYLVFIGETNTVVELIKGFVVNS